MAKCRVRLLCCGLSSPFEMRLVWLEVGANYRLSTYKVTDTITVTLPARRGVLDCDARDVYACNMALVALTYLYHFARVGMQLEPSCYSSAISSIAASFNEPVRI